VAVGAWNHGQGGAAYIVSGDISANTNLGFADLKLTTSLSGASAGWSLAGGDVDGDGLADLLVGGPGADGGRVWSVPGMSGVGQTLLDLGTEAASLAGMGSDALGWSVVSDDIDGDGYADTWVGAPGAQVDRGCVYLVLGTAAPQPGQADVDAVAEASICGTTPGERFGDSLALVPDMDGDGASELLVAGRGASTPPYNDGAVWLFRGPVSSGWTEADASASWLGSQSSDALGAGLAGGDWNADGVGDVLIGAPGQGSSHYGPGAALLFYGD